MDIIQEVDFSKYHTFFLEYYKFQENKHVTHVVRPSEATYDEIVDVSKQRVYTLDSAVATFNNDESISQILFECSVLGISIDFIDIFVPAEKSLKSWNDNKIFQTIDLHKEDASLYFDSIEAPRFYVALNKKTDFLKFLVVDSAKQESTVDFLKGEYDENAVIAGFKKRNDAYNLCKKLNINAV